MADSRDSLSLSSDKVGRTTSSSRRILTSDGQASGAGPLVLSNGVEPGEEGIDIIFVHGLNGHRVGSWTKDSVCWPRDLLGTDVQHARIITWGYPSILGEGNDMFADLAEALLVDISRVREGIFRPIYFVAHGIGGIIVKEALTTAAMSRIYGSHNDLGDIYPKTKGIIFLGTPHQRTGKRSLGECVALTAQISLRSPNDPLLRSLAENSGFFENQHGTFQMISRDIRIVCVREQFTTGSSRIVPKDSASYEGFSVTRDDMSVSHMGLARFSDREELGYNQIVSHFARLSAGPTQEELAAIDTRTREILAMLYFDQLHEKENRIEDAHDDTCDWLMAKDSSFREFLRSKDDAIFWLSGCASSGKSTLMKWAFHNEQVREELASTWAKDGDLIFCSFYLYEGGNQLQKSELGLLRANLYQILAPRPELVRVAFPSYFGGEWPPERPFLTATSLTQSIYNLFANFSNKLRFVVFVDGLNEFRIVNREHHYSHEDTEITDVGDQGDELWGSSKWARDSYSEVVKICMSYANKDSMKIIVSSRELPAFEEGLKGVSRIRVQEHTEEAMTKYLQDILEQDVPGLPDSHNLCKELARRSRGDVLWARLAMKTVLEGSLRTLRQTLDSLPPRLGGNDGLYMKMLRNMPLSDVQQCFRIWQLVLRARQPPSLITLAFAEQGYWDSSSGKLMATQPNLNPSTLGELEECTRDLRGRLQRWASGFLETEAEGNQTGTADQRLVFCHQTGKEWASRKDFWQEVPGVPPSDPVELDLALLSGCIRHLKCFELVRPPVSAWPDVRFRPEAWLLVANALRLCALVDDKVPNLEAYRELLDDLDNTCQRAWVRSLQSHKPLYEDPDWYERKCPTLCRKHWAGYEPMETGKPPKRKDFLALAIQASLVNYVSVKLKSLKGDMRRRKAEELLVYVVNPKPDGVSACGTLVGDYVDFHHDMPDPKVLDVLFEAGATARPSGDGEPNKVWSKALKAGRRFFTHQNEVTHLLETSASHRLLQNRERWVAAIKALLAHGADPFAHVELKSGSGESQSLRHYTALELIRETLEGEPEYAIDLNAMEAVVRRDSEVGAAM
ncbi:hypothetical protein PG993_000936 [Apiospora rasikravindrae]|uniref:Nephrocystin 3-like N-terminal domain-containing protein n=1 Tax=Apiospora rasikravindrae TaxID=990691 RepID=A0ABR1U9Z0_9PEZI